MAFDAFIYFTSNQGMPAVKGESQDSVFSAQSACDVLSFEWGAENPTSIGSATGGAGAGKVKFDTLSITKRVDTASPALFQICASGGHFKTATLALRKAGSGGDKAGKPYLQYTFKTVFITKITNSGSGGDDLPTEVVEFAFGALEVSYAKQNKDGTLAAANLGNWNQITNKTD